LRLTAGLPSVTIAAMSIQVLIVGIHLARSTRGKPCAPPDLRQ
jgi:hypothetical protein